MWFCILQMTNAISWLEKKTKSCKWPSMSQWIFLYPSNLECIFLVFIWKNKQKAASEHQCPNEYFYILQIYNKFYWFLFDKKAKSYEWTSMFQWRFLYPSKLECIFLGFLFFLKQKVASEHQCPDEDWTEAGTRDHTQTHWRRQEATHPGIHYPQFPSLPLSAVVDKRFINKIGDKTAILRKYDLSTKIQICWHNNVLFWRKKRYI